MGETGLRPVVEAPDPNVTAETPEASLPASRPSPAYRREWPGYGRQVEPAAGEREPAQRRGWFGPARSARTRILASYVVLLAVSAIVSILAIRQVLVIRLDDQVADALQQEMLELDRLLVDGRDPETGKPFDSLRALFDVYFARNVAGDDEGMLAFIDGELYRSTLARYPLDHIPAGAQSRWEQLSSRATGDENSATGRFSSDLGEAHFRAIRIAFRGGVGAFVVTILPQAEREEIGEFQVYGAAATLGLLLIASVFAYLVAGRVLAPVRHLTETARSISQSDLTKRIEVRGAGDAAEMGQTFNAMLDRLENVFRSQRDFVHDASHELRDPLTICRGHLELMGDDPDEQRAATALVLDELDRMARIVNDLQLLADAEHPDFLQPEWIDLELFGHELTAKATALGARHWQLESSDEGMIVADRHRLTEAMMNLAHNAVQHSEEGAEIAFGTALSGEEARLWVHDTGFGISPSDQPRIFERFVRGSDSRRQYRGGGLGLAIVSTIAAAHGGRVELESRLGEGSTFTIVIPREPGGRDPRWHGS